MCIPISPTTCPSASARKIRLVVVSWSRSMRLRTSAASTEQPSSVSRRATCCASAGLAQRIAASLTVITSREGFAMPTSCVASVRFSIAGPMDAGHDCMPR